MAQFQSPTQPNLASVPLPYPPAMTAQFDRVLRSPKGGTYNFTLQAQDQAQVLVNGALLLDTHAKDSSDPIAPEAQTASNLGGLTKQMDLPAGNHHIQLRYQDSNGQANLWLCVGEAGTAPAHANVLEIQQLGNRASVY